MNADHAFMIHFVFHSKQGWRWGSFPRNRSARILLPALFLLFGLNGCTCEDNPEPQDPPKPPPYYIEITPADLSFIPGQSGQATGTLRKTATGEAISATWTVAAYGGVSDLIESYQVPSPLTGTSVTVSFTTKMIFKAEKTIFVRGGNPQACFGLKASFKDEKEESKECLSAFIVTVLTPKIEYVPLSFTFSSTADTFTGNHDFQITDDPSTWDYVFEAETYGEFAGIAKGDLDGWICIQKKEPPSPPNGNITITQLSPKKVRISVEQGIGDFWPFLDPEGHCRWDFQRGRSKVEINLHVIAHARQNPNLRLGCDKEFSGSP